MNLFTPLLPLLVLATAPVAMAQTTVLSENFDAGVVPPSGWSQDGALMWQPGSLGGPGARPGTAMVQDAPMFVESRLISPTFDLSSYTSADVSFQEEYMVASSGGQSELHVSTDGGTTWSTRWNGAPQADGVFNHTVDLSAYAGQANVQIAFYYASTQGFWWYIDDVEVQGDTGGPTYALTGLIGGGTATITVTNATPLGSVVVGYSLTGAGPTQTSFGLVDMSLPISTLPTLTADASGTASMSTGVPPQATGFTIYTQGVDITSGLLTNSLAELVL